MIAYLGGASWIHLALPSASANREGSLPFMSMISNPWTESALKLAKYLAITVRFHASHSTSSQAAAK